MQRRKFLLSVGLSLILGLTAFSPMLAASDATTQGNPTSTRHAKANLIDINTASVSQLQAIPGMGEVYAKRIIGGRPYTSKRQLLTRGILPQDAYDKVKGQIIAHRVKK